MPGLHDLPPVITGSVGNVRVGRPPLGTHDLRARSWKAEITAQEEDVTVAGNSAVTGTVPALGTLCREYVTGLPTCRVTFEAFYSFDDNPFDSGAGPNLQVGSVVLGKFYLAFSDAVGGGILNFADTGNVVLVVPELRLVKVEIDTSVRQPVTYSCVGLASRVFTYPTGF